MPNILAMIMAGGEGKRLFPLTKDRAKPAVPYGGRYRIIDFVLNNLINSGIYHIKILTQYRSESLNRHLKEGWHVSDTLGHYIDPVPAQMRSGMNWYKGTADAIYQNLNLIEDANASYVLVFGGDHIYKMDIRQLVSFHIDQDADLTVSAIPVPIEQASEFGVIQVDSDWKIIGFEEKPKNPAPIPGDPTKALVSMGNYIFTRFPLENVVKDDSYMNSAHDFGKTIIPQMIHSHRVFAYNFMDNIVPGVDEAGRGYWKDVGTLDAYYQANMELLGVSPAFNLYDYIHWPIRTGSYSLPPAKFVFNDQLNDRIGYATDSLISEGCIISGGHVNRSILSPGVRINSYSKVSESILMHGVVVGRHSKLKRTIVDKRVHIPENIQIGYDLELDSKRFHVTEEGIVVVEKKHIFEMTAG